MSLPQNMLEAININKKARRLLNLRIFINLVVSAIRVLQDAVLYCGCSDKY